MRKTFLKWLFVFIASAFALTFGISFLLQTRQARENAIQLIRLRISDTRRQLFTTEENVKQVAEMTGAMALVKARVLAGQIKNAPELLNSSAKLEHIRTLLDVDELHVSDSKGILIASIPAEYQGYDMASARQSAAFLPALTDPDFALVQSPQRKGINQEMFQYAGVARQDIPGIVQIGYHPRRLIEAARLADIRNIASSFRVGNHGSIIICKDNQIISYGSYEFSKTDLLAARINQENLLRRKIFNTRIGDRDFLGVMEPYHDYRIIGILPKNEMYLSRNSVIGVLIAVDLLLFTLVFVLVSLLVQQIVINGIYKVNSSLERITCGDLEEKVKVNSTQEFQALSEGINATVAALKNAIKETAARIDAELQFAQAIQVSGLPEPNPVFPGQTFFQLAAAMHTAREVGGDFYDYLLIDEDHLFLLVADVSGKGIPAALFMMTSKTLLHNLAADGHSACEIIQEGNRQICAHNETGMFVTAWMGILELSSGRIDCANAGHNPPLLIHPDGNCEFLRITPGLVLGGMEESKYKSSSHFLQPGDHLVLYTDGVTEAQNTKDEFFGETRLQKTLAELARSAPSPKELLSGLHQEIKRFTGSAPQADDITLLALEFKGNEQSSLTLPAKAEQLPILQDFLAKKLNGISVSEKIRNQLLLVVEEVFINIAHYAYPEQKGMTNINIQLHKIPEPHLMLQFRDHGIPYNPLKKTPPDLTLPAEKRPIGGLGILLVRKSMDACEYQYADGQNILTLKKYLAQR
ncbi:MAG: SpoIIE family protein phosphatase [Lentisphaeria bacterium]